MPWDFPRCSCASPAVRCAASTATPPMRSPAAQWMTLDAILAQVASPACAHVCVTGGEPLAQPNCLPLLARLCDAGYQVSLETSGAMPVAEVDPRVARVVDVKTPASGEVTRNLLDQLPLLRGHDQIKFVICDRADYEWSRELLRERGPACATPPCCSRPATSSCRRANWRTGSSRIACRCACRCSCTRSSGAMRRGADERASRHRAALRRAGLQPPCWPLPRSQGFRMPYAGGQLWPAARRGIAGCAGDFAATWARSSIARCMWIWRTSVDRR